MSGRDPHRPARGAGRATTAAPLSAAVAWAMRRGLALLPAGRRDWPEAVLAEADDVPAGPARLRWLLGGVVVLARQLRLARAAGAALLVSALGVAVVSLSWHGGTRRPGAGTQRAAMVAIVLVLALMPVLARLPGVRRGWLGEVAGSRTARAVRVSGYLGVWALLLAVTFLTRYADARFSQDDITDANERAQVVLSAVVAGVVFLALFTGYAAVVFALTSRRAGLSPRSLALGAGLGVAAGLLGYALAPFGGPLHLSGPALGVAYLAGLLAVPALVLLAGLLAARPDDDAVRGLAAGLLASVAAALVITVLTLVSMTLFPHLVPLRWANPDPYVPHGTDYEWRMSVEDDAGNYLVLLILGPFAGLFLGLVGATVLAGTATDRPGDPDGPGAEAGATVLPT